MEGLVSVSAAAVVLVASGASCTCRTAGSIKRRISICIVELSLLRIAQNCISFSHILEFLLCVLVSRICVRMVFLCEFSVSGFQFFIICTAVNAEHCV